MGVNLTVGLGAYVERFLGRVTVTEAGCWEIKGHRSPKGYVYVCMYSKQMHAHRAMWMLRWGPIPDGLQVLHRCDNPPCCNPAHLWLGTHDDNMADMVAKGRSDKRRGEDHHRSRLTDDDVAQIRRLGAWGVPQRAIAQRFGVTQSHVWRILNRLNRVEP